MTNPYPNCIRAPQFKKRDKADVRFRPLRNRNISFQQVYFTDSKRTRTPNRVAIDANHRITPLIRTAPAHDHRARTAAIGKDRPSVRFWATNQSFVILPRPSASPRQKSHQFRNDLVRRRIDQNWAPIDTKQTLRSAPLWPPAAVQLIPATNEDGNSVGAGEHCMPTWTLVLLLNFGTPQQTEVVVLERVTWEHCIARGFAEIRRRALLTPTGVRCEPGNIRA